MDEKQLAEVLGILLQIEDDDANVFTDEEFAEIMVNKKGVRILHEAWKTRVEEGLRRVHDKGLLFTPGEGVEVTILSTGVNFVGITRQAHKMREGEPWLKVDGKGKHRVFARPVEAPE